MIKPMLLESIKCSAHRLLVRRKFLYSSVFNAGYSFRHCA
jgi:hypothetical protein